MDHTLFIFLHYLPSTHFTPLLFHFRTTVLTFVVKLCFIEVYQTSLYDRLLISTKNSTLNHFLPFQGRSKCPLLPVSAGVYESIARVNCQILITGINILIWEFNNVVHALFDGICRSNSPTSNNTEHIACLITDHRLTTKMNNHVKLDCVVLCCVVLTPLSTLLSIHWLTGVTLSRLRQH